MKKIAIVSAFIFVAFFGARFTNAEVVQTDQKIKCIPTYTNPCTNEGMNLGSEVLGNNNSGGIANPGNKDPKDMSGALSTLGKAVSPLKLNSMGPAVKALQEILIEKGFFVGVADGKFGVKTQTAVEDMQKANGLKVDGIMGAQSFSTLENISSSTNTNTNTSGSSTSSSTSKCTLNSKPSISVLSPNAAGTYYAGGQVTVKWSSCNVNETYKTNDNIAIILRIYSNQTQVAQVKLNNTNNGYDTRNDGIETVKLPTKLPDTPAGLSFGKNFKISVGAYDSADKLLGEDYSDSFFTLNISPAEKKKIEDEKKAEEKRIAEEKKKAEDEKKAEEKRIAEEKKKAEDEKKAEEKRIAEEKKKAEDEKKAEEKRIAEEKKAEEKRIADEKKAEEKRIAEEKKRLAAKKNTTNLYSSKYCPIVNKKEEMFVMLGETINEATNSIYRLSDIWSTTDGANWKQLAQSTAMGEKWEPIFVKTKDNTVYEFGGKYVKDSAAYDTSVYKSKDMVNWTYVGGMPGLSRYFDKSVVYFKDKFWLIGSDEGKQGVWSSSDGATWDVELKNTPWDGKGYSRVTNNKGFYDSNSLGAFVLNNKIWYLVYNNQPLKQNDMISIYSSDDGKNWKNEGLLKNSKDGKDFNISVNTNPAPVVHSDGKVYIMSTIKEKTTPIVINTSDGVNWNLVSTNKTSYSPGYYSTDLSFAKKLWKIGGLNFTNGNDNTVYNSSDGVQWSNKTPKGLAFPSYFDRHLAGGIVLPARQNIITSDLEIINFDEVSSFTTKDVKQATLGIWKLSATAAKNKKATGDIKIESISLLGTNLSGAKGDFSSLESLRNIKIYSDSGRTNEVASLSQFSGPFYDTSNTYVLPQTIKLSKPIVIKQNESVNLTVVADFSFNNDMSEFNTYLASVGFAGDAPCAVYNNKNTRDVAEIMSPGIRIIRKSAAY
jgi:peptidoglycan hydrolase-like protein with peptidoglycan-binding domain